MNKFNVKYILGGGAIVLSIMILLMVLSANSKPRWATQKINGVSFVAPPQYIEQSAMLPIKNINSNWVAITPYAFSRTNEPTITHNHERQWWGERPDGTIKTIEYAHNLGLKVMIKPHVWVRGQSWAGDFTLSTNDEWNKWFLDYKSYILTYAIIAEKMKVELLCIGTEYRIAATTKPELWLELIDEIKRVYSGKLTYAANWDNYQKVTFWNKLDYIGIDAYFPLSNQKTPNVPDLNKSWTTIKSEIQLFSNKWGKPILFTEYGYESRDFAADGDWKYDKDTLNVNLRAQTNAYTSLFDNFWQEEWFLGGFLWKWHAKHDISGGTNNKRFTPQNKPVQHVIKLNNNAFK